MRSLSPTRIAALALLAGGCAWQGDGPTLEELRHVEPEVTEIEIDDRLEKAVRSYRRFLDESPVSAMTPEAMRRLADLKIEREYGILGGGQAPQQPAGITTPGPSVDGPRDNVPPTAGVAERPGNDALADAVMPEGGGDTAQPGPFAELSESREEFERRATAQHAVPSVGRDLDIELPGVDELERAGPLEAIELYERLLAEYPDYPRNDQVLYQKARAYEELGRIEDSMRVTDRLLREHPDSRIVDEVLFRRAEFFFTRSRFHDAEEAYSRVVRMGPDSPFYELSLYKLGWTLYKQDLYEAALQRFMALLDYKVATGYDFDQQQSEDEERRVEDTYRVISLSFSILGGADVVEEYFSRYGNRSYENRIYSHLGEFFLDKFRYQDAASVYDAFVSLYPFHRAAPHFSMRVVEIYGEGGFPRLVVEGKKDFATDYGLDSEYWQHFDVDESSEVVGFLKENLNDLANHYHALYQDDELVEHREEHYSEALHWYREFLASFPEDPESPQINYQLADLLLEHENFGTAAREYERTAYGYPAHERAAEAGYAAVYAHREHLGITREARRPEVRRETVESSLKFVDTFPEHEQAPLVLGAAADDLFEMNEFAPAIAAARKLLETYPETSTELRRDAWIVVAHASFELDGFEDAEHAYTQVLALTPDEDESHQNFVDNLAASIYQQGDAAREAEDFRAAAEHFLRIRDVAPTSAVRASAEYDAGAALIHLEDWAMAASVLDEFRRAYPEHEMQREATRQIAFVYREDGQLARAAAEHERISAEAEDEALRREALLLAGELYEEADSLQRALDVYVRYAEEFPRPLETAVETRHKIAGMHEDNGDDGAYRDELQRIVDLDAEAGSERTDRTRYLAAQSALVLAEPLYERFAEVELVQPFAASLEEKNRRMDVALEAFDALVDYEVGEVTAAATYYMAEIHHGLARALVESERPTELDATALEQYEMSLEEEAFPFEQNAIDVHEKNLELMAAGVYNHWIEGSLDRLADLMPGRYAKDEISSGFLGSIEDYTYEVPSARTRDDPEDALEEPSAQAPLGNGRRSMQEGRESSALIVADHGGER